MAERSDSLLLDALGPATPAPFVAPIGLQLSPWPEALLPELAELPPDAEPSPPAEPPRLPLPDAGLPVARGALVLAVCLVLSAAVLFSERAAPPAPPLFEPAALPRPVAWPAASEAPETTQPAPPSVLPVADPDTPPAAAAVASAPPPATPERPRLRRVNAAPSTLIAAHTAYAQGNLARAGALYLTALAQRPGQPDALLGLAALAERRGQRATARAGYAEVLTQDPAQWAARAGLWSLSADKAVAAAWAVAADQFPPRNAEDLARRQDALGRAAAAAGRWAAARTHFAEAVTAVPEAPDYAYALAVSLDQLGLPAAAIAAYGRALALGARAPAGFSLAAARARLVALATDTGG